MEKTGNAQKIPSPNANRRNSPKSANKILNLKASVFNPNGNGSNEAVHKESTAQWVNRIFVQEQI